MCFNSVESAISTFILPPGRAIKNVGLYISWLTKAFDCLNTTTIMSKAHVENT